jgi:ferredoxin/protein involved in ribonucleotide reduction
MSSITGNQEMKILYFTSTGNSLYVARTIGGTLYSIPQLLKSGELEVKDDVVGLVFPCYVLGLPHIVERFLQTVKIDAEYTFAVITYGNFVGNAASVLARTASSCGIKFDYINAIVMADNYLPMFDVDKQKRTLSDKDIEGHLQAIVNDIVSRKKLTVTAGAAAKGFSSVMRAAWKFGGDSDKGFVVNNNCNMCGTCAKVCPVGNIEVTDSMEYDHRCEWCLGCIHACPRNAIHLKKEKSNARYINEHVTLTDIIASNHQTTQ